jgi:hypothetical protein
MPSSRSASCSRCAVRCSAYFSCACGRVKRLHTGACLHKHVVGKRGACNAAHLGHAVQLAAQAHHVGHRVRRARLREQRAARGARLRARLRMHTSEEAAQQRRRGRPPAATRHGWRRTCARVLGARKSGAQQFEMRLLVELLRVERASPRTARGVRGASWCRVAAAN